MQKLLRLVVAMVGAALFATAFALVEMTELTAAWNSAWRVSTYIGVGVIGALIGFAASPKVTRIFGEVMDSVSATMEKIPMVDVAFGTGGLLIGLLIANLVTNPLLQLSIRHVGNIIGVVISVLIYFFFGVLGIRLALKNRDEIISRARRIQEDSIEKRRSRREKKQKLSEPVDEPVGSAKVLDTSVIIDGRIFEVIRAGFLEGPYIISKYVLEELQFISDSSDPLKRERGRRGLDMVKLLQDEYPEAVLVDEDPLSAAKEVDAKLLILTRRHGGKIVTNDYNLNKVASVQELPVLNVNELANALKPVVIPGERMTLKIIKQGKDAKQGLAYLSDGTMIVVENGGSSIGRTVDTVVTSVLQTSAGKMIFTRI